MKRILIFCMAFMIVLAMFAGSAFSLLYTLSLGEQCDWDDVQIAEGDAFETKKLRAGFEAEPITPGYVRQTSQGREAPLHGYEAPEGFILKSYSSKWRVPELKALYEELLKNVHGEELYALREVIVEPEEQDDALAYHTMSQEDTNLYLYHPALGAGTHTYLTHKHDVGTIVLHGGDTRTTVQSMALSLSHEYGHHYSFYHFGFAGDEAEAAYATLRGLPARAVVNPNRADYEENYAWTVWEIAANDYVQLMGSPTTRQSGTYYDGRQALYEGQQTDWSRSNGYINGRIQGNLAIPLATDVQGLADYYYSFVDDAPPATPVRQQLPISLRIEKRSNSYRLVSGYTTFTYYHLTFDKPYTQAGVLYTVLCYGEDARTRPIKSVTQSMAGEAYIGNVSQDLGDTVRNRNDFLAEGTKTFVVLVMFPDGTFAMSERLEYHF